MCTPSIIIIAPGNLLLNISSHKAMCRAIVLYRKQSAMLLKGHSMSNQRAKWTLVTDFAKTW